MRRRHYFSTTCNNDCCRLKTALDIRRMQLLIKRQLEEAANVKPKDVVETPQSALYSFNDLQSMANYIIRKAEKRPRFGIICGSNLEEITERIEDPIVIDFSELPNYPISPVHSHKGKFVVGRIMGGPVIAVQGRMHHYEGNPLGSCTMPVRIMKLCGVKYLFLASSTGGLNPTYKVGDVVLLKDHINVLNWCGRSPLNGPNEQRFGDRFVPMIDAYDETLLEKATEIGREIGQEHRIHQGVYICVGSPGFETLTEQKFLRTIGGDLVGMSIVPEVILARHCGIKVFSFGLITRTPYEAPAISQSTYSSNLSSGQKIGIELISRIIYKIQNNL